MNIKSIALLTTALALSATTTFAAPIAKTEVKIVLENFPKNAASLMTGLKPDDAHSIHISAYMWVDADYPFVDIWGNTAHSSGNPSLALYFVTAISRKCKINFTYGTHGRLAFRNGLAPSCENMGLSVGELHKVAPLKYTLTVKDLA